VHRLGEDPWKPPSTAAGGRCVRRQASRSRVSTRIVTPTDLCSWNSAKPLAFFGIEKPSASWNASASAISQWRTIAPVL
jgi:hypothetical protein